VKARMLFVSLLSASFCATAARTADCQTTVSGTADNSVRYYEQDGVTYREVRSIRKRPVVDTRYEQRERTVYREQVEHDTHTSVRSYLTPVTEYQLQPRMHGVLNPFVPNHVAYHYVPVTRWETRTEEVRRPIVRRSVVPEKTVVNVPVTEHKMVDEEVITRTAVNTPSAIGPAANVATRPIRVGGQQLTNDPPREGWSSSGVRRY